MYTQAFQMSSQPFVERPQIDRILKDERITQGLMRLEYWLSSGTIALISGKTGVGKSSLIKYFLNQISRNLYHPVYIHITDMTALSFLKQIVSQMGERPRQRKNEVFNQIMEKARESKSYPLLIVDEAHLLHSECLTSLRLLVSSAVEETPPLKILLAGQESLVKKLQQSSHGDLANRISVHHHLPSLNHAATTAYIDHQIKSAGGSEKIFDKKVKTLIFEYSGGIPRQINNLATSCLIHAASQGEKNITEETFIQIAQECQF